MANLRMQKMLKELVTGKVYNLSAMKSLILKILSTVYCVYYKIKHDISINQSSIIRFKLSTSTRSNQVSINRAILRNSSTFILGCNNSVQIKGTLHGTCIKIYGNNNKMTLDDGCAFYNSCITVRGENCNIHIGKKTTFGSVYMVCMGKQNEINIGDECMFAENIDIWNTDSHPIINMQGEVINPSRPIYIGDHVWVGKGCKILKGVKIASNSIIGMNSLVTKNIAENTLNVGSPSTCIQKDVNWDRGFITV